MEACEAILNAARKALGDRGDDYHPILAGVWHSAREWARANSTPERDELRERLGLAPMDSRSELHAYLDALDAILAAHGVPSYYEVRDAWSEAVEEG